MTSKTSAPEKPARTDAPAKPRRIGTPELAKLVRARVPAASQATVTAVVNATVDTIAAQMLSGTVVALKDFGKFERRERAARTGRNPRTGETIHIPAATVTKFTFAKALKSA